MLIFPCTSRPKLSTPKWVEKYFQDRSAEPQIPPLRYAPVGMTILLGARKLLPPTAVKRGGLYFQQSPTTLRSGRKTFPRRSINTEISPLRCASVEMTKGRADLPGECRRTADPSTTLRSGRDDNFVGSREICSSNCREAGRLVLQQSPTTLRPGRRTFPREISVLMLCLENVFRSLLLSND
jgi:hypothetical protein